MPLQQYSDPAAGGDDQPQAKQLPQLDAQEPQLILLPSYPEITDIDHIFDLEAIQALPLHNDHPVSRLTTVFISKLTTVSTNSNDQDNRPLTNRHVDSFLEQAIHFLNNLTNEDITQLVYIMYGEWTPPQAVITEHIVSARTRLSLGRDALLKNDPQLCMSILYNHKLEYALVQFWSDDNDSHFVNENDPRFGINNDTTGITPFFMLDSAYTPDRFLCHPDSTSQRVHTPFIRGSQPDGFLEDIPHSIIQGTTNLAARSDDMSIADHFSHDINTITSSGTDLYNLAALHLCLSEYMTLWTTRLTTPHFTHPDLPPPRVPGSITYHCTATPSQMLDLLSARCDQVRRVHVEMGKLDRLPREILDFIEMYPVGEGMEGLGREILDQADLDDFVNLAE